MEYYYKTSKTYYFVKAYVYILCVYVYNDVDTKSIIEDMKRCRHCVSHALRSTRNVIQIFELFNIFIFFVFSKFIIK